LKEKVAGLAVQPKLVSVVFQEDAMGMLYTNLKAQAANEVGIEFEKIEIQSDDGREATLAKIREKCSEPQVSGLLIQKPRGIDKALWEGLTSAIDPKKDVDCLTRANLDKLYRGESDFLPATARAVVSILEVAGGSIEVLTGKNIVVVGRSELVGKPVAAYLKNKTANIKMLGSRDDIRQSTTSADVIISATGKASLITGDMVREGVIVIDVGEPKGDVDFESVSTKATFITPVPGGVGPMTVVSLLANILELPVV
jgi:methylenetetrahydrofolate dehydrogenase (NADP+)/methenyltetrahydrofolate cyclohydrolase